MTSIPPTPAAPSAQLDPAAVVGRGLELYRDHAAVLVPLALGLFAIQFLLVFLVADTAAGAAVALIGTFVLSALLQGMVVELARDAADGRRDSSIGQLASAVSSRLGTIILASLVYGIGVAIGFVLLLVPGFFLLTIWAVAIPVVVLERRGVFEALGRSRALVRGNGWQVFALVLVMILINALVSGIAGSFTDSAATRAIVNYAVSALAAPLSALLFAVAYLRLRELHGEAPLPAGAAGGTGAPPAGL